MSYKKRKKRKSGKSREQVYSGPRLCEVPNPFAGMRQKVVVQRLREEGEASAKRFEDSLAKLLSAIRSVDALHLLSVLSLYGLTVGLTDSGKQAKRKSGFAIQQADVELVQALALHVRTEKQSFEPARPATVQGIWDLLIKIREEFVTKRLAEIGKAKAPEELSVFQLQERIRSHTHFVRNWGFFRRVIRIAKKLYSPLDKSYETSLGLSATDTITVFEHLVGRIEKAMSDRVLKLRPIRRAKTIQDAARKYCKLFPDVRESPDTIVDYLLNSGASLDEALTLMVSHADLRLPELFTFSYDELASCVRVNAEGLNQTLRALSYQFGDLSEEDPRHFFLTNPVWTKPVIRLPDSRYFCPMPQLFFSFILRILDGLLVDDPKAVEACINRRSEFLEREVAELFLRSFPGSEPTTNFKWSEGKEDYETDLLVQIDSYLILLEAKSGSISLPALRGAPARAKRHIRDLIGHAAIQSDRFATKVLKMKMAQEDTDSLMDDLPFDLRSIRKIIRLSVTLEDFATIQSNVAALKGTGWLDKEFKPAPTMTLADLEIVFDLLPDTPQKLHYLVRRAELEEHVRYFGNELDLLGLYLQTGFNIGQTEFGDDALNLAMMSKAVDEYYVAQDSGFNPAKPMLKSTRWWREIRQEIERKRPKRWSEAAVMLLNVSYEDQLKIQDGFRKVARNVKRNWRNPLCKNAVGLTASRWRQDAFVVTAYREKQTEFRDVLIHNLVDKVFSDGHASRCLLIGVNIDRSHYPYTFLSVHSRRPTLHDEKVS